MEWLSQNWLWIVFAVGALWFFSRARHGGLAGGCCGMAHEGPHEAPKAQGVDTPPSPARKAGDQQIPAAASSDRHGAGCH